MHADPTDAIEPPKGCETTVAHERKFTALANLLDGFVGELLEPPAPTKKQRGKRGRGRPKKKTVDPNAIVKLADASIKARRAASSLARQREDDAEAMRIEQLDDALVSGGAH